MNKAQLAQMKEDMRDLADECKKLWATLQEKDEEITKHIRMYNAKQREVEILRAQLEARPLTIQQTGELIRAMGGKREED